jgi:chorismate mutase
MDDLGELQQLRKTIDEIDTEILALVAARVRAALAVGEIKRRIGRPIYDPEREREILQRLASAAPAPLSAEMAKRVFERLIDECRHAEHRANEK